VRSGRRHAGFEGIAQKRVEATGQFVIEPEEAVQKVESLLAQSGQVAFRVEWFESLNDDREVGTVLGRVLRKELGLRLPGHRHERRLASFGGESGARRRKSEVVRKNGECENRERKQQPTLLSYGRQNFQLLQETVNHPNRLLKITHWVNWV